MAGNKSGYKANETAGMRNKGILCDISQAPGFALGRSWLCKLIHFHLFKQEQPHRSLDWYR